MKKAVFLHVFKAGGTSVYSWLKKHYDSAFIPADPDEFHRLVEETPEEIRVHNLIFGHMYADDALRFRKTHRSLTVLRRPEEHLMSALWHLYVNSNSSDSTRHTAFDQNAMPKLIETAEQLAPTGGGMQSLFFAPGNIDMHNSDQRRAKAEEALRALARIDIIGITGRMPETFRLFASRLGIPRPWLPRHYRNAGAGRSGLPPELREILKHHLEIDQQLYDAAVRRFERDLSRMEPRKVFWR